MRYDTSEKKYLVHVTDSNGTLKAEIKSVAGSNSSDGEVSGKQGQNNG